MTTPNGHPAWIRSNDHATYGGDLNKRNWQGQGAVNAESDVDAQGFCRLAEDLSECIRTAAFSVLSWTCNDTAPAAPTITAVNQMTGYSTTYEGDAAPSGYPSGARNGNGDCTFTFPAIPTDAYGVSEALTLNHALPGSRTQGVTGTSVISGVTVRVRLIDVGTGTASVDPDGSLMVA